MGITEIDHVLVVLGISLDLNKQERIEIASEITRGMENKVLEANTKITGGQTVLNPWIITGGTVMGVVTNHLVDNKSAEPGDKILLTKPLGTQLLINFKQYLRKEKDKAEKILKSEIFDEKKFDQHYENGINYMKTLNLNAAKIMNRFGKQIKACTDITGFGLKGHADNLVQIQNKNVNFLIHSFPVLGNLYQLDGLVRNFQFKEGLSAETSGGLMIVLSKDCSEEFIKIMKEEYGQIIWEIGEVTEGNKTTIIKDLNFIEI